MKTLCLEPRAYSPEGLRLIAKYPRARKLSDAEAVFVRVGVKLNAQFLKGAPNLRAVVTATTGTDHIDLDACRKSGVSVLSLRGKTAFLRKLPNTAEHAFALLLSLYRRLPEASASVAKGKWEQAPFRGRTLAGKRYGIVGYGRLGSIAARIARGFGMEVSAYDPGVKKMPSWVHRKKDLLSLARESDVLALFASLEAENHGMIGKETFQALPRGAVLVNVARGALVDERALLQALKTRKLAGAALDVLDLEPPARGTSLAIKRLSSRGDGRVVLTPHIGGQTEEAVREADAFILGEFEKWRRKHG